MTTAPQFASVVGTEITALPATANTNRDGTGTVTTFFTAGSSGSRVERIKFKAIATTTAGMVRIYIHDGTNFRLLEEIPVVVATVSATVEAWEGEIIFADDTPLFIPNGWTLKAAPHNAEAFHAIVVAGDF